MLTRLLSCVALVVGCATAAPSAPRDGAAEDCDPNRGTVCVGDSVHTCNDDGSVGELQHECGFESCFDGHCVDACGRAAAQNSYEGCEFWPVDLDNAIEVHDLQYGSCVSFGPGARMMEYPVCASPGSDEHNGTCDLGGDCSAAGAGHSCVERTVCVLDAQHAPFAIVVSNPNRELGVDATLENGFGVSATVHVSAGDVVPLFPQQLGFPDQSLDHTGIERSAYRLTTTAPVIAYQFNPFDEVGVFSNDASLLIPAHAYGTEYVAATRATMERRPRRADYDGYVTLVASAQGSTRVSVTPTAPIRAGESLGAVAAGTTVEYTLKRWETLSLHADTGDLTGTRIVADAPIGAFAGHEAVATGGCCADHLEDQLLPTAAWGRHYAVVKSAPRGGFNTDDDLVRIVARSADTFVTVTPSSGDCDAPLSAGEYCEVATQRSLEIDASKPVLVAHFLTSSGMFAGYQGDPALAFAVPVEQFRDAYAFLVPDKYDDNYVSLVAATGAPVVLDGVDVTPALEPFGSGTFSAGVVEVTPGRHELTCPGKCGVEVYGWSEAVSYLYAGGLDLAPIAID